MFLKKKKKVAYFPSVINSLFECREQGLLKLYVRDCTKVNWGGSEKGEGYGFFSFC